MLKIIINIIIIVSSIQPAYTYSDMLVWLRQQPAGTALEDYLKDRSIGFFFPEGDVFGDPGCVSSCIRVEYDSPVQHYGWVNRGDCTMHLRSPLGFQDELLPENLASVFVHEVQHKIDHVSGWHSSEPRSNQRQWCLENNVVPCDGVELGVPHPDFVPQFCSTKGE